MRLYQAAKRLEDSKRVLSAVPFQFGPNKRQELVRLIFEVSQRENIRPFRLFKEVTADNDFAGAKQTFTFLKEHLLKRRYPHYFSEDNRNSFYLPKIDFDDRCIVIEKRSPEFYPETIFVERDAKDYPLTKSILSRFPRAKQIFITSFKQYIESVKSTAKQKNGSLSKTRIQEYNLRTKNLFLVNEYYDFLKPCPCTQGAIRCGYRIVNLGFGCIYDCSYCFLQNYTNCRGIVLPVNSADFLKRLEHVLRRNKRTLRMGTGEFSDSLALDDITGFARMLIEFFSRFDNATIELKTKSANVKHLLSLDHNRRSVIAWSLNPQSIIDTDEWKTSSLRARLDAARQCVDANYLVAFHFDPIIYLENWEKEYRNLIDGLFSAIKGKERNIAWISLGTLRFNPRLKTVIEQRFPNNSILNAELILEFDNKLRYSRQMRFAIYEKMYSWIRKYSRSALVYLCMESKAMWQEVLSRKSF